MTEKSQNPAIAETQAFYDNRLRAALEELWGEHLHLALFERYDEPLGEAQARATARMAEGLALTAEAEVLEVACGVGAAARHLARTFGCHVLATNISDFQIARGEALTTAAGLDHLVAFDRADFHALDHPDASFDCWWCQEALLHSADKQQVLAEGWRVLRPGGWAVLSDVTVPSDVGPEDREKIYARVQSPGMWDPADHRAALTALGFDLRVTQDWSQQVARSYGAMRDMLAANREALQQQVPAAEIEQALAELRSWVDFAQAGKIGWSYFLAQKPVS